MLQNGSLTATPRPHRCWPVFSRNSTGGHGLCREIDEAATALRGCSEKQTAEAEEWATRLKAAKKKYRMAFDHARDGKAEVRYLANSVDVMKAELLSTFEKWYVSTVWLCSRSCVRVAADLMCASQVARPCV